MPTVAKRVPRLLIGTSLVKRAAPPGVPEATTRSSPSPAVTDADPSGPVQTTSLKRAVWRQLRPEAEKGGLPSRSCRTRKPLRRSPPLSRKGSTMIP
jgi:hypothetical protein